MAGAADIAAPVSVADPVPGSVKAKAGLAPDVVVGVSAQLEVVLGAARAGGLSGVSSEQALQVVEAVEALKAWAEAISIDATAVMVTEFETDFAQVEPGGAQRVGAQTVPAQLQVCGRQGDPGRDRPADHAVPTSGVVHHV